MKNFRSIASVIAALLMALALVSCASQQPQKAPEIVWPLPPDEPKIKYVTAYYSNVDVEDKAGIAQAMFGEENKKALKKPYGVAVDNEGSIYVTDIGVVFVFDLKNKKLRLIGDSAGLGKLKVPIGIAVSREGRVYVSDTASDRIFVYDRYGKFLSAIGREGELDNPAGIAIDEKRQRIYVSDSKKHNVKAFGPDGKLLLTIGKRGTGESEFNFPTNVAVDDAGEVFVVDTGNNKVKVFAPDGKFIRNFGAQGDYPGSFVRPKGIAIDTEGHLYVVDAAFQNFQIFTKEGRLLLFVGEGGEQPGQFLIPAGITIDDSDRIYVADQLNKRVQVFQYLGEKWKKNQGAAK